MNPIRYLMPVAVSLFFLYSCTQPPPAKKGASIALSQVAEELAMRIVWEPIEEKAVLEKEECHLVIKPGSNIAWICGEARAMPFSAYIENREVHIPLSFYQELIKPLTLKQAEPIENENGAMPNLDWDKGKVQGNCVVIDAGHGGHDPGAVGPEGKYEKIFTLDIAQKVAQHLIRAETKVILTRQDDTYVSLDKRVQTANGARAHCFVSIHLNSAHPSAHGFEIWLYHDQKDSRYHKSMQLARYLRASLKPSLPLRDRGIRKSNFKVVRETTMPAVLIECAFISNKKDLEWVSVLQNQEILAQQIAQGVLGFLSGGR